MEKTNLERVTVPVILSRKSSVRKISAVTAYDYSFARLVDQAGVEMILVGDSLGSVVQGLDTTLGVTLDEMIYHCRCVTRAVQRALVVGDLPFLTYQISPEQAMLSAGRLLKEGGVSAVKLEGGVAMAATIARLTAVDIPVIGHVGLTPQSVHRMGGYKVQGRVHSNSRRQGSWEKVIADAQAVQEAGAFAIVLEGICSELAHEITTTLQIPTIGIGAGVQCDGQILVLNDLLGMGEGDSPRFVKKYADLRSTVTSALQSYVAEVEGGKFPTAQHEYRMPENRKLKRAS